MTPQALKRILRQDDLWDRFQNLSKNVSDRNDLVRLRKELLNAHAIRPSRRLASKKGGLTVTHVMDASLEDIATRSRAVEIMVLTSKDARLLRSAMDAVTGHILSE